MACGVTDLPVLPAMPPAELGRLTERVIEAVLDVFGPAGVVGIVGKGSAFKGDFIPGYSDVDLHVFLDSSVSPMLNSRTPGLEAALAFQRAVGGIDGDAYGAGKLQVYFVDALRYPEDWTPPVPGTSTVLWGELPRGLPAVTGERLVADARSFFARIDRDLAGLVGRLADKPDRDLEPLVRLVGTGVKPCVYHAAVLLETPPLEAWSWPLQRVLEIVEPVWCPSRRLTAFFTGAHAWNAVRKDPERLRRMFETGHQAVMEVQSHVPHPGDGGRRAIS